MIFQDHLVSLGVVACTPVRRYVGGKTFEQAWNDSKRADWMMWLCGRMAGCDGWPSVPALVDLTSHILKNSLEMDESMQHPSILRTLIATSRWCYGQATQQDVLKAKDAILAPLKLNTLYALAALPLLRAL